MQSRLHSAFASAPVRLSPSLRRPNTGHQHRLVLIDNCEHVTDAAREVVDRGVRAGPRVHVLATSREHLGLAGEVDPPRPAPRQRGCHQTVRRPCPSGVGHLRTAADRAIVRLCERVEGMPSRSSSRRHGSTFSRSIRSSLCPTLQRGHQVATRTARHPPASGRCGQRSTGSYDLLSRGGTSLVRPARGVHRRIHARRGRGDRGRLRSRRRRRGRLFRATRRQVARAAWVTRPNFNPRDRLLEPLRQFAQSRLSAGREAKPKRGTYPRSLRPARGGDRAQSVRGRFAHRRSDCVGDQTANIRAASGWAFSSEGGDREREPVWSRRWVGPGMQPGGMPRVDAGPIWHLREPRANRRCGRLLRRRISLRGGRVGPRRGSRSRDRDPDAGRRSWSSLPPGLWARHARHRSVGARRLRRSRDAAPSIRRFLRRMR